MTKQDILDYLNSLRKSTNDDSTQRWIGSYNGRQIILRKFFRWLYSPEELDQRKRLTPTCMKGIKQLPRKEKNSTGHQIFELNYLKSINSISNHFLYSISPVV